MEAFRVGTRTPAAPAAAAAWADFGDAGVPTGAAASSVRGRSTLARDTALEGSLLMPPSLSPLSPMMLSGLESSLLRAGRI